MPDCKTRHAVDCWFVSLLLSVLLLLPTHAAWADPAVRASGVGPDTSTLRPEYAINHAITRVEAASGAPRPEYASSSMSLEWRDDASPARALNTDTGADNDVWQRIRSGFKLADVQNPLTAAHESWYAARPDYVKRMVERSRRYLFHIVTEVERRSMPMEIALLPMIESAFNPKAYSPSDASGIWQFIASTGRNYGLRQDNWYDGRRDITAATNAALDYLGKLYLDFGDWQLALAAYNCGEGCVSRAIQKNLQRGLPTDYASLPLSAETRNYVPKLLAVKNLVLDPQRFGVALDVLPNQPYFAQVAMRQGMDVRSAARLAGMSMDEFTALNPAFQRNLIRTDTPVNILVPVDKSDHFTNNLQTGVWDTWKPQVARKGERIETLAQRYNTSVERLNEHNNFALKRGKLIRTQAILVPIRGRGAVSDQPDRVAAEPLAEPSLEMTDLHTVGAGETLYAIARRYHTTVDALRLANPDMRLPVQVGQTLQVPHDDENDAVETPLKKVAYAVKTRHKPVERRYTVRRGDTLAAIARRFDVALPDLKSWNPVLRKSSRIQPGTRLRVGRN